MNATLEPSTIVALVFSTVAIVAAMLGVLMQNDAMRYSDLGEVPDVQGAFLGGEIGGAYETRKDFYRDLRAHYRRSASGLSMIANLILLVSVVAGVLAGWTTQPLVAIVCGILWIVAVFYTLRFTASRRQQIRERETALETRRTEFNQAFFDGMADAMGLEYAEKAFIKIEPFERVKW